MRVFLVDSQPFFREQLKRIIARERDLTVVGEAATWHDMLQPAGADLLILDEELDSLQLLNTLLRMRPKGQRPFVLVFTKHTGDERVVTMLKAGADGCLCKSDPPSAVLNVIRTIARKCKPIPTEVDETSISPNTEEGEHSPLSLREYEVLCLLASGMNMSEIAGYLSLSAKTIRAYRASLLKKLKLKNNAQMIGYAFKKGMVA
jgi:two-component system invasion response regulator UvrY